MNMKGKSLNESHDPKDPSPWLALFLDSSIPLNNQVKQAWLEDTSSGSRQYLLPIIRPFARLSIIVVQGLKIFLPKRWQASKTLHKMIYLGLKHFVSPQANWLVMRHFHIGSEIQKFIVANLPGIEIPELHFMRFQTLAELKEDAFLNHDINLYNFVIWLNQALKDNNRQIAPPKKLDFSMISTEDLTIEPMPTGPLNKIDLLTAIEVYTPVYQLFLTDSDFWRATNSLQLDETIAIYVSKILNDPLPLMLVNNKHPMIPLSTLRAGFRLVIHGLASEMLHAFLVKLKLSQELGQQ